MVARSNINNYIFRDSSMVEQLTVVHILFNLKNMKESRKYADRREYIIKAVSKRHKKLREMAIEYGGGKCALCGYNRCGDALEFHHTDSSKKEFGVSQSGLTRSWEKTKDELDKCILVCANCHRELHNNIRSLPEKSGSEE